MRGKYVLRLGFLGQGFTVKNRAKGEETMGQLEAPPAILIIGIVPPKMA